MSKWCNNDLTIKGNRKDLIDLKKKLEGTNGVFTCENIIPRDSVVLSGTSITEFSEVWGSKWEPSEVNVGHDILLREQSVDFIKDDNYLDEHDLLIFSYTTAWSPISPVIARLSELFPKLHFIHTFEESGDGFHGIEEYFHGLMIRELDLPLTEYGEDGGEPLNLEEIEEILNGDGGYLDFTEEFLKDKEFTRHEHQLYEYE